MSATIASIAAEIRQVRGDYDFSKPLDVIFAHDKTNKFCEIALQNPISGAKYRVPPFWNGSYLVIERCRTHIPKFKIDKQSKPRMSIAYEVDPETGAFKNPPMPEWITTFMEQWNALDPDSLSAADYNKFSDRIVKDNNNFDVQLDNADLAYICREIGFAGLELPELCIQHKVDGASPSINSLKDFIAPNDSGRITIARVTTPWNVKEYIRNPEKPESRPTATKREKPLAQIGIKFMRKEESNSYVMEDGIAFPRVAIDNKSVPKIQYMRADEHGIRVMQYPITNFLNERDGTRCAVLSSLNLDRVFSPQSLIKLGSLHFNPSIQEQNGGITFSINWLRGTIVKSPESVIQGAMSTADDDDDFEDVGNTFMTPASFSAEKKELNHPVVEDFN